jgi:heme exporter protein C
MEAKPRLLKTLDILTIVLFVVATGMVFLYAPMEVTMGRVQRVFYFHVASAWVGHARFFGGCGGRDWIPAYR